MKKLSQAASKTFQKKVYSHYRRFGRAFPWRVAVTPYRVLVSEIMLQQTQASRVATIFPRFVKQFPTVRSLARASHKKVFLAWQGLGYNRRARYLHLCAQRIVKKHKGIIPRDPTILETFPGIGKATAASICAFAYDMPTVFIETNIRSVFIHEFFPRKKIVSDQQLTPFIAQTLDVKHPSRWYNALMDYGAFLKESRNPSRASAVYAKQKPFENSLRQARGALMALLLSQKNALSFSRIQKIMGHFSKKFLWQALMALEKEKLIQRRGDSFFV